MAAVAAASGSEQAAAREPTPAPAPACPRATLDPQLFMAARRGDSELLKHLLQLKEEEEEEANAVRNGGILETNRVTTNEGDLLLQVVDSEIEVDDDRRSPSPSSSASHDDDAPPPPPVEPLDEDGVTMEGDSLLHVVAACGDKQEFLDCVDVIVRNKEKKSGAGGKRRALEARNNKGDTPLHCAAGAGNAHMISCLVALVTGDEEAGAAAVKKAFLRMQNECGETALHQAIRAAANKLACIDHLMDVDPDLACIPHDEEGGASPLYLAISLGEVEIAPHLLLYLHKSKGKLSYCGPDGRNVLHAAVCRGQATLHMVLGWLRTAADMRQQEEGQGHDDHLHLLSQLTSQRDKANGSTPLHLAASVAGLPSPLMYKTHPQFWAWSGSPARLLLDANESPAYQPDKGGLYPIHVAGGAGSLRVVKALLWRCPDCATLRDAKGRTFLHIAVEQGRYNVVRYVCYQSQRKQNPAAGILSSILNMQDIEGNTPLHRAIHAGNLAIFNRLVGNRRVRLDVPNNKGMGPIDVSWSKMPLKAYYAWDSRIRIRKYLLRVGAPYSEIRGDRFDQKHILPKQDEEKMSADLTAAAQVLCIFSALITTVTFASAFTLPGGYRSAGDVGGGGVAGTPVLAGRSYAFDAFVLSDTLAFLYSIYATSVLLYVGVPHGNLNARFRDINLAYTLMWHAGRSMLAAFGLGLYIVLLPVARTIAIAIGILMAISVYGFIKASEGIDSMAVIGRSRIPSSAWSVVLGWIIDALYYFWSYLIIFGLPAIRKWARLP